MPISTFGTRIVLFLAAVASLVIIVAMFATQMQYKPYGVHDLERVKWDRIQADIQNRKEQLEQAAQGQLDLPVVRIDEPRIEFGVQAPFSSHSHAFRIENDGPVPLELSLKQTSDAGVRADLSPEPIGPGETAEVLIHWNTDEVAGEYQKSVEISTGDPRRPSVTLSVTGQVPTVLAMNQPIFHAPRVEPDQRVEASAVVYSQVWDDFDVRDVHCDLEGFQWSAEPLAPEQVRQGGYRSAYRLTLSVSRDVKGTFEQDVKITVQPPRDGWRPPSSRDASADNHASVHPWLTALQQDQPLLLESSFRGRVISRISFYGENLHVDEGLDVGLVSSGTRQEFPLLVRHRGRQAPASLAVLDIQPPQLQASIEPLRSQPGTYRLVVIVPEDASPVVFNADQQHGFVQVGDPEHPEVNNWFPVMGAIVGKLQQNGTRN